MNNKIKTCLILAIILPFTLAIVAMPDKFVPKCLEGILLWAECVLPSLFPFMVVTLLLIKSGIVGGLARPFNKCASTLNLPIVAPVLLLMSACSGYPAGSRIVCEYYERGEITQTDAQKLSLLCSTSGPLFLVGSVGFKMFGDKRFGYALLICHLLANVAVALLYSLFSPKTQSAKKPLSAKACDNVLYESFYSAVISVIVAGGFIAFFYTVASVAMSFELLRPFELLLSPIFGDDTAKAISLGLFEVTGGCAMLCKSQSAFALPLCGFLTTFGGISILFQQLCYLKKCKVKTVFFISFKFLQAVLCFALLFAFSLITA